MPQTFAVTRNRTFSVAQNVLPNREKYMGKTENKTQEQKPKSKTKNKNQGQLKWSKKYGPYEVTDFLTVNAVAMYNNKFPESF